jgi:hypothetical protein
MGRHTRKTRRRYKVHKVGGGDRSTRTVSYKKPDNIPHEKVLGKKGCKPGTTGSDNSCLPSNEFMKLANGATSLKEACDKLQCQRVSDGGFLEKLSMEERERLLKGYFRPKAPEEWKKDPDAWLDNFSIEAALKQYEEIDPSFMTLGAVPIDFAAPSPYNKTKCLLPEFCKLNLNDLRAKGKRSVGMVFNLDPHFKDGSHWVALFLNVNKPGCYYFDSYGMAPPKQIKLLMETLWSQDNHMELGYNGRRFQYSQSECGMYSLYFIICMHYGIPFKTFVKQRVKDEVMLFLRSWLFFDASA